MMPYASSDELEGMTQKKSPLRPSRFRRERTDFSLETFSTCSTLKSPRSITTKVVRIAPEQWKMHQHNVFPEQVAKKFPF